MRHAPAVAIIALLLEPPTAIAQEAPSPAPAAHDPDAQIDLIDVWHIFRHQPVSAEHQPASGDLMIVAAPVIGNNPTFGFTLGGAAQLAFVAGSPDTTRISSSIISVSYSSKQQTLVNARFDFYTNENTWLVQGDNRFYDTGQSVYGLGAATPASAGVDATYDFVRVHETAYRRVRGPLYIGAGLLFDSHSGVAPASGAEEAWSTGPYVQYSQQHGLPVESQQSGGVSVNLLVDERVGEIDPRRGWMASAWYRASFDGFLSGDSNWQLAHAELRAYIPLGAQPPSSRSAPRGGVPARHRLAIWTFTDLTTGGAPPFLDLPETVSDTYARSSRGYRQGRYRGERLVYGEIEYRGMLTRNGLLGMVAFANVTTLTNLSAGEQLFDSYAPAAGGGVRLLFNKRSRSNLCIDAGFGKDGSKGVYLAIQDAF